MRFTIKREELLKGLNIANRAISSKIAMPVLENLKFELTDRGLFITGSNLDISIKTQVPFKLGEEEIIRNYKEGVALIKAKIISDVVRKQDADEITIDVVDSTVATVNAKGYEVQLTCMRPDEYPDLDLDASGTKLSLSSNDFVTMVNQTAFAASTREQYPILTALNLEARDGILTATATDSARLAKKTINIPLGVEFLANVPAKMIVEVSHLLEGKDSIDIAFSDKKALFTIGTTVIATRLIADNYPNTKNIVPKNTSSSLEVNANDLMKAIERATIFSPERVNLSMSEDSFVISAKAQADSTAEKIELFKYVGPELKIALNSSFVIAAVKALGCADVTFAFVGEKKPFIIENASDDSIVQIVTPMRTF